MFVYKHTSHINLKMSQMNYILKKQFVFRLSDRISLKSDSSLKCPKYSLLCLSLEFNGIVGCIFHPFNCPITQSASVKCFSNKLRRKIIKN